MRIIRVITLWAENKALSNMPPYLLSFLTLSANCLSYFRLASVSAHFLRNRDVLIKFWRKAETLKLGSHIVECDFDSSWIKTVIRWIVWEIKLAILNLQWIFFHWWLNSQGTLSSASNPDKQVKIHFLIALFAAVWIVICHLKAGWSGSELTEAAC